MRVLLLILNLSITIVFATDPSPPRSALGPPELPEELLSRWNEHWRAIIQARYQDLKPALEFAILNGRPHADEAAAWKESREFLRAMLTRILITAPQGEDAEEQTHWTGESYPIPDDLVRQLLPEPSESSVGEQSTRGGGGTAAQSGNRFGAENPGSNRLQMSEGFRLSRDAREAVGSVASRANRLVTNVLSAVQQAPSLPHALGGLGDGALLGGYPGSFVRFQPGFAIP
ncbi:MAG: hypothetical protein M1816_007429 [Peltula sp. TS41687]|nr:MAG: hypothetical protein M1816_007429 [Peltula sp. TS41687]